MNDTGRRRLIIPLDVSTTREALTIVRALRGRAGLFKVGLQLFCQEGPEAVRAIAAEGARVFLDLKLHDIPNTVARAVAATRELGVAMLDVHVAGGERMVRDAVLALGSPSRDGPARTLLLGITVLTSLDDSDLRTLGVSREVTDQVVELARVAQRCGLDGVVASPLEITAIKRACGQDFVVVAPGVRPAGTPASDQKRTMTPAQAIAAGADYLVIGRPILESSDPAAAAEAIVRELPT